MQKNIYLKLNIFLLILISALFYMGCDNFAGQSYVKSIEKNKANQKDLIINTKELSQITSIKNLNYVKNGDEKHKLDLYLPTTPQKSPLIVFVHGGGWRSGDKKAFDHAIELVNNGYAVASVNYRLSNKSKFPAQIHDIKTAIRWLRFNANKYNINKEKVGIWGISAGGNLASLVGVSSGVSEFEGSFLGNKQQASNVQAVVDWFGPVDPTKIIPLQKNANKNYSVYYDAAGQLLGNKPLKDYSNYTIATMNPLTYIDKDDPPFLIMHGGEDGVVPVNQSRLFYNKLKKINIDVIYKEYPNEVHHLGKDKHVKEVLGFFNKHLKT